MTVRPITIVGHRALERRTRKVREITEDIRTLVADMFETNDAADGAGLAAPQVGSRWRLFIYSCPDAEGIERRGVVINPRLERYGPLELEEDTIEGCLSVPGEGFPTARHRGARVTGIDLEGQEVTVEDEGGVLARALQHAVDHREGSLYLDRRPPAPQGLRLSWRDGTPLPVPSPCPDAARLRRGRRRGRWLRAGGRGLRDLRAGPRRGRRDRSGRGPRERQHPGQFRRPAALRPPGARQRRGHHRLLRVLHPQWLRTAPGRDGAGLPLPRLPLRCRQRRGAGGARHHPPARDLRDRRGRGRAPWRLTRGPDPRRNRPTASTADRSPSSAAATASPPTGRRPGTGSPIATCWICPGASTTPCPPRRPRSTWS